MQQVRCSGSTLDPSVSVLGMTLYTPRDQVVLAHVNFKDLACFTWTAYSACLVHAADSRQSALVSLVLDWSLMKGSRDYACNVTCFRSGQPVVISWSVTVNQTST